MYHLLGSEASLVQPANTVLLPLTFSLTLSLILGPSRFSFYTTIGTMYSVRNGTKESSRLPPVRPILFPFQVSFPHRPSHSHFLLPFAPDGPAVSVDSGAPSSD